MLIVRCIIEYTKVILYTHHKLSMNIKEKVGKRLRELRVERGFSQEKFSFECGLDRTYIASIEQGKRNVSIVNIEKIVKALNISISDFFNSIIFSVDGNS
ncbi:helix-turn-helix domain-containing protein [Capnocytophaga canimorsus]|uniref:helix-turn-helix domain-containing protein n=1 Tax=Capnocytophaga canimorsus TaxID=28188 RepID=UPI00385ADB77